MSSIAGEDLSAYALKRCSQLHGALSKGSFTALAIAHLNWRLKISLVYLPGFEIVALSYGQWH